LYYLLKDSERWKHSSVKWYCTKKQTESFYIILALDVLVLEIAMDKLGQHLCQAKQTNTIYTQLRINKQIDN